MHESRKQSLIACIKNVRRYNQNQSQGKQIALMAIATGLSIIAICEFLLQEEGPNQFVSDTLIRMKEYYGHY